MEQSNKRFNFAVTISLYSEHKLNKFLWRDDTQKSRSTFQELSMEEQNEYLERLFCNPLISRKISHKFFCETHPDLKLKGNKLKQHLHGIIYDITKETMDELKKLYLNSYIKVKTDKAISNCWCCVPMWDDGYEWYIVKTLVSENYYKELDNHLDDNYIPDSYQFKGKKLNIIKTI